MLRKGGPHEHKAAAGPPKPLCKNFGQLPKLTGDWVDHSDPSYMGLYSQVKMKPCRLLCLRVPSPDTSVAVHTR